MATTDIEARTQELGPLSIVADAAGDAVHRYALRPPFLLLVQKESDTRDAEPGTWYRTDTQEAMEAVDVVPLRIIPTRRKWPAGAYRSDRTPECWSDDGRTAAPNAAFEGQPCGDCAYRRDNIFAMTAEEDGGGQACAPTHAVIVVDAYEFQPLLLNLGSKTMSRLVTTMHAALRKSILRLSANYIKMPQGSWWSPQAKRIAKLEDDDLGVILDLHRQFAGAQISTVVADDESPPAAPEEPGAAETRAEAEAAFDQATTAAQPAERKAEGKPEGKPERKAPPAPTGKLPF